MSDDDSLTTEITAIEPGRRRGRFNIYLNGEFAIAVGVKVLADLGLKVGQQFSSASLNTIASAAERERAMQTAVRFLETRARSKREITQRLNRDAFTEETIETVIAKLAELKLIDDAEFAERWVESRSRSRPKGIRSLRSELMVKGIAAEDIDAAIEPISSDNELELAKSALSKRLNGKRPMPEPGPERDAEYRRLITFLQRRGFDWSTIKTALASQFDTQVDEDGPSGDD